MVAEGLPLSQENISPSSRQPDSDEAHRRTKRSDAWRAWVMSNSHALFSPFLFFIGWMTVALLLTGPASLLAQMPGHSEPMESLKFSVSAASLHQFKSDVSGGGDFSVTRYFLSANGLSPISDRLRLGIGLSYEFENYDFSNLSGFTVPNPWNKIDRIGLSTRLIYRGGDHWDILAGPMIQYTGERGADFDKSVMYGGIIAASYRASRNFAVGFGAGVFYRLEETRIFPSLIVSWKITDRLRLGNSSRVGPAGPAGLELQYMVDQSWEIGVGGGYRSLRFRLDKDGPVPGGIGENNSWPVYVRLGGKLLRNINFEVYAGVAFGGELWLEDRHGNDINSVSYNAAPVAGITFSASF